MQPIAIDLFCGLGGWTEGLLSAGYRVIGFDIERHRYPKRQFALPDESSKGMTGRNQHGTKLINAAREQVHGYHTAPLTGEWEEYPAQLVIQDVRTLHGSQFKSAALIVASPPCQAYSYRAMPWKKAKALPPPDNSLFEACFRIQREAIEAAGHHIPLVVENVCGAQKWVGRARWHFGSFYLWGDVPALMPIPMSKRMKFPADCAPRMWRDREYARLNDGNASAFHHEGRGRGRLQRHQTGQGGDWFNNSEPSISRKTGSKSSARKAASALIAKIPFVLSSHIGQAWLP